MEEKREENLPHVSEFPEYCTPVGVTVGRIRKVIHPSGTKRFIGVDLSKQSCYVCIINRDGQIELHRNFSLRSDKRSELYEKLQEGDLVLMEASTGTFNIARALNKLPGVLACVVNPHSTRINETKKKTDKEDSLFLAKLILRTPVEELQLVSIPSDQEMENRDVISHYRHVDNRHTQVVNQLHALFFDKGFPEVGKTHDLHTKVGRYGAIEKCFGTDRAYSFTKRIAKDLSKELSLLEEQQAVGERQMARIVKQNDRVAAILGSIPGVGLKTIAAFIAFVGDVERFSQGKQLSAYCGLVPRVYQSGQKDGIRKITKEGQAALREYLVEAVFAMMRTKFNFPLKEKYLELRQRMKSRKAAIAVARKLVVMIFSMLKKGTLYMVEKEENREQVAAYHKRKYIQSVGRYYKFRESCKDISAMIEITNTFYSNELGVLKFKQQGA